MATTAPRSFRRAAKKEAARPVSAFNLVWEEDLTEEQIAEGVEPEVYRTDTFHATRPTEERLFVIASLIGDEDSVGSEATGIMDLLRDILPSSEFRILKERLLDPEDSVNMEVLEEVLEWLMEAWAKFPTQPSSASVPSPTTSGTKSTGRARGPGSIPSTSPSIAS